MGTKEQDVELLVEQIKNMMASKPVDVQLDHPDESFRKVQEAIAYLSGCLVETNEFLKQLSSGNLETTPPDASNFMASNLAELHSGLQHLSWQAKEVVKGDYKQKSNFLGEFSNSFNSMIEQLEERENRLIAQSEELSQSMELMVSIMDKMTDWVIAIDKDSGEIIYANRAARENYYGAGGKKLYCQNQPMHQCVLMEKLSQIRENREWERQLEFTCPSCKRILQVESTSIRWNDRHAYVHFLEDITHEVGELEELQSMAFQDELTGLYNRRYCMNKLNQLIERRKLFSVCTIDLNQLKVANDTHGHLAGDDYIITVADEMKRIVDGTDGVACRVGGDEFVLLLPGFEKERAMRLMIQMESQVAHLDKSKEFSMSISYGVVDVLPKTSTALERILKEADDRMYEMKEAMYEKLKDA